DGVVQDHGSNRFCDGGEVGSGPVDGDEKGGPQADIRVIRDDVKLLAGAGEVVQRLADGGAAVCLEHVGSAADDAVTVDSGDDGLAGELLSEVDDAVVISHDFHVAVVVGVVQREQLLQGTGPERVEVPAPQCGPAPGKESEDKAGKLADEQYRQ